MNTATASPAQRITESWRLEKLGHGVAATLLARSAIEVAIGDRLDAVGAGYCLSEIHKRVRQLCVYGSLPKEKASRIKNVFVAIGSYAHARPDGPSSAADLIRDAEHVLSIIDEV